MGKNRISIDTVMNHSFDEKFKTKENENVIQKQPKNFFN